MNIIEDDLLGHKIAEFLADHLEDMQAVSPPESKHALDLNGLRQPDISFWSVWDHNELIACAALKEIEPNHGEVKSMRVAAHRRGTGVASKLLQFVIDVAQKRGYQRLSLETGSMPFFNSARALYQKHHFTPCPPFGEYTLDPNSVFMTRILADD